MSHKKWSSGEDSGIKNVKKKRRRERKNCAEKFFSKINYCDELQERWQK